MFSWVRRTGAFFLLWLALSSAEEGWWQRLATGDRVAGDMVAGLVAAWLAAAASLRLLAPGTFRARPAALLRLAVAFFVKSIAAGWDLALRALAPKVRLEPGYHRHTCGLGRGPARETFLALTSLVPGALPVRVEGSDITYHVLDKSAPNAGQLANEERLVRNALETSR